MRITLQIALVMLPLMATASTNELSAETSLSSPIQLDELLVWRDGGSLGFKLSDTNQHRIAFCVDYRIGSPTAGYFFLDVTHATQSGAQKLDLGGKTEKKLISYLDAWLTGNFTREQLTTISGTDDVGRLSKDEFKAWHVVRLVQNRAKAIERARAQPDAQADRKG